MSAVRLTHTPCAQPVDLDEATNRILEPDSDLEHRCAVTDGPYSVIRWGRLWTIEHVLDRYKPQPVYHTQHAAQTEADRRNRTEHTARTPRPAQPDLFSNQEAA